MRLRRMGVDLGTPTLRLLDGPDARGVVTFEVQWEDPALAPVEAKGGSMDEDDLKAEREEREYEEATRARAAEGAQYVTLESTGDFVDARGSTFAGGTEYALPPGAFVYDDEIATYMARTVARLERMLRRALDAHATLEVRRADDSARAAEMLRLTQTRLDDARDRYRQQSEARQQIEASLTEDRRRLRERVDELERQLARAKKRAPARRASR